MVVLAVPGSDDLVVMASNMEYGSADASSLVELVETRQVDVLVLLEVTEAGQRRLAAAGLGELLPERSGRTREDAGGTLVLSRLPLQEVPGGATAVFDQPVVMVDTDAGPVMVHAAHPYPPFRPARWREELADLDRWARAQPTTAEGGMPVVVTGTEPVPGTDHRAVWARLTLA